MRSLAFPLALLLLAACGDDKTSDSASKAPPPPEQGGVLGAAVFRYKCVGPSDPQCDFDEQLGAGNNGQAFSLPSVALGAKFGLEFSLNPDKAAGAAPEVSAFHPTFATSDASGITAVKVGMTTVGLKRGNDIVDMLDVKIVEPKDLKIFQATGDTEYKDVALSGGKVTVSATFTFRFRVAPVDGDTVLAGSMPCKWTSSDENIAKITTPADDNIVTVTTGNGNGTTTIHVDFGTTLKKDIPITVGN